MANINVDLGTPVPVAKKTDNWLESMFIGLTGTFNALSGFIAGEEAAEQAGFRGRQATRQIGQIGRDVETGAERIARGGREFVGRQRAAIAKSGVALSGSAEQAIAESDKQFALDVAALKHRGALATIEKQAEADMARIEERGAKTQARLSLLQGAVGTASRIRLGV
jgi:hypothetical protein